jgi:hypothetical protein
LGELIAELSVECWREELAQDYGGVRSRDLHINGRFFLEPPAARDNEVDVKVLYPKHVRDDADQLCLGL